MLARRIIPCLDIKDGRVVKGTSFVGLRDAGDPVELAQRYNTQSADELVFLDITASKENRSTTLELAARLARELFIPFTIGGGISTPAGLTHTSVLKLTDRSWNSPESTHKHKESRWHQALPVWTTANFC